MKGAKNFSQNITLRFFKVESSGGIEYLPVL